MDFRILGSLEAEVDGVAVGLSGPAERKVLAVLLLDAGRMVPVSRLVDALWEDDPPATAAKQARNVVSRLRRVLAAGGAPDLIMTEAAGYRIRLSPDDLDATRFEALAARAQAAAGRPEEAARLLRAALGLWRGRALAGLPGRITEAAAAAWEERRLAVAEAYYDHQLRLGRHREILSELSALVAAEPLREWPVGQLMVALYRSGRQTDALARYRQTRAVLDRELGLAPGAALTQVHQQILTGDPALAVPAAPSRPASPSGRPAREAADPPVPRQLPARPRHFSGRRDEQKALTELLDETTGGIATATVVAVISGPAGIGKTALALHWGHQVAAQFPDGQLYVSLRGFDPAGTPVAPAEVVRAFLAALGTPPGQIPAGPQEQAGLYRTLMAGRRVLIIADNARTAQQVRPLLPASPGCLVIVTSRSQLTGLVATDDASPLGLDLLSPADARELLTRRLGPERLARDPAAAGSLIEACARLPLALSIAAARAATRPSMPLAALAAELGVTRRRLDALQTGDEASDVRTVFSWSYRDLSPAAGRMFRLLGLHPGPDITVPAAASLAGLPLDEAAAAMRELIGAQLIAEPAPGRFALHDLLRAYAAELAGADEPGPECAAATARMLDHYLHTGHAAAVAFNPARVPLTLPAAQPGVTPEPMPGQPEAETWFAAEQPVLLTLVAYAERHRADRHAWPLAWAVADFLQQRGPWTEWAAMTQLALAAAQRLAEPEAEARTRHYLGYARARLADYPSAHEHFDAALRLFGQLGDQANQAHVHLTASIMLEMQGRPPGEALDRARQALDGYRAAGHRAGEANALNAVGWYLTRTGQYEQAVPYCQEAIDLHRELGNRDGEAATWDSLAHVHQDLGDHGRAIECYLVALELRPGPADGYNQALTLTGLGDTYLAAGQPEAAREAWRQALDILEDLHHPGAEDIRDRLG